MTVPALYLRAQNDRVVSRASSDYIRKVMPAIELVELEAPHLLPQTVPRSAKAAIGEFVDTVVKPDGD